MRNQFCSIPLLREPWLVAISDFHFFKKNSIQRQKWKNRSISVKIETYFCSIPCFAAIGRENRDNGNSIEHSRSVPRGRKSPKWRHGIPARASFVDIVAIFGLGISAIVVIRGLCRCFDDFAPLHNEISQIRNTQGHIFERRQMPLAVGKFGVAPDFGRAKTSEFWLCWAVSRDAVHFFRRGGVYFFLSKVAGEGGGRIFFRSKIANWCMCATTYSRTRRKFRRNATKRYNTIFIIFWTIEMSFGIFDANVIEPNWKFHMWCTWKGIRKSQKLDCEWIAKFYLFFLFHYVQFYIFVLFYQVH